MTNTKQRYYWVDNVKIIAIVLVVLGHLVQSFLKSGILQENDVTSGFISTIYTFHVPLFFICSGFLYQQFTRQENLRDYGKTILKKLIAFGVPYFVFVTITHLLKMIFNDSVNTQNSTSLIKSFFVSPIAPYWFLYVLFFLFLLNPIIKSKASAIIRLALSISIYFIQNICNLDILPAPIYTIVTHVFRYSIWFIIGMLISYFKIFEHFKKYQIVSFFVFLVLIVLSLKYNVSFNGFSLILGLLACAGIIGFVGAISGENQPRILSFLSKYIMPIFLMHTLCASTIRSILFKIGITSSALHVVFGLVASFVLPIILAKIMEKIKLDFLYNPTKYIKIK